MEKLPSIRQRFVAILPTLLFSIAILTIMGLLISTFVEAKNREAFIATLLAKQLNAELYKTKLTYGNSTFHNKTPKTDRKINLDLSYDYIFDTKLACDRQRWCTDASKFRSNTN